MRKGSRAFIGQALLAAYIASVASVGFGQFLQDPIRPSVSVSEKEVPAGSTFDVVADFELDAGVRLYKKEISFKWEKLVGAEEVEILLPKGRRIRDELGFSTDGSGMIEVYEGSVRVAARMRSTGKEGDPITLSGKLSYAGCTDEICYPPGTKSFEFNLVTIAALPEGEAGPGEEVEQPGPGPSVSERMEEQPVAKGTVEEPKAAGKKRGAIWLILMAFAAGVGVSLTPCVYPMIPITAAIVGGTKQKGKLAALLSSMVYVLGISITYSVLGLVVASGGEKVRTALASPWVLVPIAGVFVLLALSMFDVISIQFQPKGLTRLQSALSGKGRIVAIFALGIVSGLVAGPCITAPLAGILVIVAREANKLLGFVMLFVLAWGMGIILIVAGTFTGALPKAGEWMVWVKKLLGFVLLWAAAYFLSSVIGDTAYRMATAVLLIAAAVFLGGFDTLTKESGFGDRMKRFIGLMAVLVAAYLLIGGIAGKPPGEAVFLEADYEEVENALASGQAVVLDFYAERCKGCKELDEKTFSDPQVASALRKFRTLKVDIAREPELVRKFAVPGAPTIVFVGSDGQERARFSGFRGAKEFLGFLKRIE